MSFFRKSQNANYNVLNGYEFYTPGFSGMFALLLFILIGAIVGNILSAGMILAFSQKVASDYGMLIAYPVMFIPAMIYAKSKGNANSMFSARGFALDSNHFGKAGGMGLALLCMVATVAAAFSMDIVNAQLPPMPQWLKDMLDSMVNGKLWVNFISVSIFAPIFEEWLCRGMVLRGLLNYRRKDRKGNEVSGIKPVWAIMISALFFAFIHLNPWQALPAFALGLLFGYVYYRTGSLKLTMLMHFTNNTFALVLSNMDSLKDMEYFTDVMPLSTYLIIAGLCVAFLAVFILILKNIALQRIQGNSDIIYPNSE